RQIALTATPAWQVVDDPVSGPQRVGILGLAPAQSRADYLQVRYNPVEALAGGVARTWGTLETTVYFLGRMLSGQVAADQLHGPLGIANVTGKVAQLSAEGAPSFGAMIGGASLNLLQLAALISVSIGFMNLLPVPM